MRTPRQKKSVAPINLVVSLVFHALVIALLAFLAAREGYLGKKLKTIAVTMAPKEKPPEPEKPKEPDKVPEPTQQPAQEVTRPQLVEAPPPTPVTTPPVTTAPAVAPPPVGLPAFSFTDGAKAVESTSDPIALYRNYVEFALRSRWTRPDGVADEQFVAEVELAVGPQGEVLESHWKRGSGHAEWDESVRRVLIATRTLGRPPPRNFPPHFLVRFEVASVTDAVSLP